MINNLIQTIYKSNIWFKIIVLFIVIYLVHNYYFKKDIEREGFVQTDKFIVKHDSNIYDGFYSNVYKKINVDVIRDEFQVGTIVNKTNITKESIILDIGSGTGEHVNIFNDKGYSAVGLDKSQEMVNVARKQYPAIDFTVGDATDIMVYPPQSFTHICCFNFTIYEINDKNAFLNSCYEWLKPGGFMALHLVDPNKINPVLNLSDPGRILTNPLYGGKSKNNTNIRFKDIKYKKIFNINDTFGNVEEVFKDPNNRVRKYIKKMNMPKRKIIINAAKKIGFIQDSVISLQSVNYNNEYIYIFYKPE